MFVHWRVYALACQFGALVGLAQAMLLALASSHAEVPAKQTARSDSAQLVFWPYGALFTGRYRQEAHHHNNMALIPTELLV